jgi:Tfp pilus assembly protein PilX
MNPNNRNKSRNRRQSQRGVALVVTLLLLILMIALTLAMVIATSSDTLINHYYRNFRSSFYAADSGLNIARESIFNQLQGDIANPVALGTAPLSTTEEQTVEQSIANTYGTSYTSINGGQAGNSWPGKFKITNVTVGAYSSSGTSTLTTTCTVTFYTATQTFGPYTPCATAPAPPANQTGVLYNWIFPYTLTAMGQSMANEAVTVQDSGSMVVNVTGGSSSTKSSFAAWGTFLDQYPGWPNCGDPFAQGTLSGPFFTNQGWTFGSGSPGYIFTDTVGSVAHDFYWNFGNNNNCDSTANSTDKQGGTTIAPTFQNGYQLGQTALPLPQDDFNQKEAVVDGKGNTWSTYVNGVYTTIPANTQYTDMSQALLTVDGTYTPYPSHGTTNPGVYLAYSSTTNAGVTTNTMTGGGIYVEGNADSVVLSTANPTINGTAHSQEVYTIAQGNTTTTVTVDLTSYTTTTSQAVTTTTGSWPHQHTGTTTTNTTIQGVPENLNSGTSSSPATMLYVDGTITSLSGPSSGAAIQNGAAVTVTAASDVNITGNLTYATEPVTTTQNQIPNTPADTLIPGNNNGQVFGIFTAGGNILFNVPNSGQNLEIDASLAAVSKGGSGAVYNGGNQINTVNIIGGRIANTTNNCNCNQRNIYFDRRFATGGFAPPWFPSTTVTTTTPTTGTAQLSISRTQWVDVTAW